MKRFIETSKMVRKYENGYMVGVRGHYMSKRFLFANVKASLSNNLYMSFDYKGYTIEKETDLWALRFGMFYRFFKNEYILSAFSAEDAISQIDELTINNESN